MGVKYGREYNEIMHDLTAAIAEVPRFYEFFEMDDHDWSQLDETEQQECVQTLADDLFYGLGAAPQMHVGQGVVAYDKINHVLKVFSGENMIRLVYLV